MPSPPSVTASSARSPAQGVFRKDGEYWTVGWKDRPLRLKESKGLAYLALLLRHPTTEFHVLDLVGGLARHREDDDAGRSDPDLDAAGLHVAGSDDAGELLDDRAKATYRRRLEDLREELTAAKAAGRVELAEGAEREIASLTAELARAVGLRGRSRRAASASERARQSVTKTTRAVVERIGEGDAALGELLSRCIRTGTFCSYEPDPAFPIAWEFGTTGPQSGAASMPPDEPGSAPAILDASPFLPAARTPFVGRKPERDAIRSAIQRASHGRGELVMLAGGPGVGKSRLAMEMADHAARRGFRVLRGHCYERDEPFPFLPFAEILESGLAQAASLEDHRRSMGDAAAELAQIAPRIRRALPDLPEPRDLPPQQRRRHLFQSFSESLARSARAQPQLYLLEDLHWADESSLALLVHLAHGLAQVPVVIVATFRPELDGGSPALRRTLEELIRLGIRPLRLAGLSRDETYRMLEGLDPRPPSNRVANLIFDVTEGNPFFVQEVYHHLIEDGRVLDAGGEFRSDVTIDQIDVPENVRLVIGRRLDRLSDSERKILAAAAVIGRSFSFQLVRLLLDQLDVDELCDAFEKAQQMGLLVSSAEGPETPFTFAHEIVRQTLLHGIALPRRQRLHAGVAHAIKRLHPRAAEERAGEIADHLFKAGAFAQRHELAAALFLAGKAALGASAFEEAHRAFESALAYQDDQPTVRAAILSAMATADHGLGRVDEAFVHGSEAIELHVEAGDRDLIGRSFNDVVDGLVWARRYRKVVKVAQRGLSLLAGDRSAHRVRLLCQVALITAAAGEYEAARDGFAEAMELAQQLGDGALLARVLSDRAVFHYYFCELEDTIADGRAVEEASTLLGRSSLDGWRLGWMEQAAGLLGRLAEARQLAKRLDQVVDHVGQREGVVSCIQMRAWVEFGKDFDLARLHESLERSAEVEHATDAATSPVRPVEQMHWPSNVRPGVVAGFSSLHLSLAHFLRGDWDLASALAEGAYASSFPSAGQGAIVGTLFRQRAYLGDRSGALALPLEAPQTVPSAGRPNTLGAWNMLVLMIEGLSVLGEREKVAALYPLALELLATRAVWIFTGPRLVATAAGTAAAAAGKWQAAERHFAIASQQAEELQQRLEQVELRRFRAMMLLDRDASGDRAAARALLGEAAEHYARFGMPRHRELTEGLLATSAA
ncbi:MAG: AAA family ATPase [Thermodesulfobacteriota bacterium]